MAILKRRSSVLVFVLALLAAGAFWATSSRAERPRATPPDAAGADSGYARRTILVDGVPMTFVFYKGFFSELVYTPEHGDPILVYRQKGVFHTPEGKAPYSTSILYVQGGPEDLDIELLIDDGPREAPTYEGTIKRLSFRTGEKDGELNPGKGGVRPLKGADEITWLEVEERGARDRGGIQFRMEADSQGGGGVTGGNTANTCPPWC